MLLILGKALRALGNCLIKGAYGGWQQQGEN